MSQQNFENSSFVPPPPPSDRDTYIPPEIENSPFERRTLIEKTISVKKTLIWAFALGIVSIPWCVFMLIVFPPFADFAVDFRIVAGAFISFIGSGLTAMCAFGLANNAVQTIDYYSVALGKRPIAVVGKLMTLSTIFLWILGLVVVVFLWRRGLLYQIGFWLMEQRQRQFDEY